MAKIIKDFDRLFIAQQREILEERYIQESEKRLNEKFSRKRRGENAVVSI
jgi:hypothetical protein